MSFRRGVAASAAAQQNEDAAKLSKAGGAAPRETGVKTCIKTGLPIISTGVSRMDEILEGGLAAGSIFLVVEDDPRGQYASILCQYSLSEGIACGHRLAITPDDQSLLDSTPALAASSSSGGGEDEPKSSEELLIAWRYKSTALANSASPGSRAADFAHQFDLAERVSKEVLASAQVDTLPAGVSYRKLTEACANVIKASERPLRIVLRGIGSPKYVSEEPGDELRFVLSLRSLLRGTNACAWVTVPAYALSTPFLPQSALLRAADFCVALQSFSSEEPHPAFKQYHGMLDILRLPSSAFARTAAPATLRFTFKLRRRGWVIDMLHLPPELEDSAQRIASAPTSSAPRAAPPAAAPPSAASRARARASGAAGCASSAGSPLDF